MNLPGKIALKYVFSKKKTNAIHIISGVTVFGISIGTAALLLVLAVFNGFEDLLGTLFGYFNPDIKIEVRQGKFFPVDRTTLEAIRHIPGVEHASVTIEEVAFFEYEKSQDFGTIKGVDSAFHLINHIDSTILDGTYTLRKGQKYYIVLGAGLATKLSLSGLDPFKTIQVYMPVLKRKSFGKRFRSRFAIPAGIFQIEDDVDVQYALADLTFVRELLGRPDQASAIELGVSPDASRAKVKAALKALLGEDFTYKDRYEQNEAFFKIMRLERWMYYAIISLAMVLVAFNMIGSLWMTVLEKRADIALLQATGMQGRDVFRVFFFQGMVLLGMGIMLGFILATVIYMIHLRYGIVHIPAGFATDRYPMSMRWVDFPVVGLTVLAIGAVAAYFPARKAREIRPTDIRR